MTRKSENDIFDVESDDFDDTKLILWMEQKPMLSQFTVKNYKSIRDEMTFDMQATVITEHTDRIITDSDEEQYLPVSVIYGPNGGGKSNVLEAVHVLISKVLRPIYAAKSNEAGKEYSLKRLPVVPFAFDKDSSSQPTEFELFFRTTQAEYRYILKAEKENVLYEQLDRVKLDTGRRSALFVRSSEGIDIKSALGGLKVSEGLSNTIPLISYLGLTYGENEIIADVTNWFEQKIDFLNYGNPLQELRMAIAESDDSKKLVLDMIDEMDLDIVDFRIEQDDKDRIEVYTTHEVDGNSVEISLEEESSGTRKLFGLLPFIAKSILYGTTLVIDELDAKIHPVLLKYIIELYTDMSVNRHGAQLIFTSHDLSTMNSDVFRRDEIWFVAKGDSQNSKLYSLVEFKNSKGESVRKDAKFDKQYLEGKYGADPYLQKIIDWSEPNA